MAKYSVELPHYRIISNCSLSHCPDARSYVALIPHVLVELPLYLTFFVTSYLNIDGYGRVTPVSFGQHPR